MKKQESRPTLATSNRPGPKPQRSHSNAPRPRRGPWPDAPLRRFLDWPQGLTTFLEIGAGR
jgi:hypothetical protein